VVAFVKALKISGFLRKVAEAASSWKRAVRESTWRSDIQRHLVSERSMISCSTLVVC
jgi:hypothetical protein